MGTFKYKKKNVFEEFPDSISSRTAVFLPQSKTDIESALVHSKFVCDYFQKEVDYCDNKPYMYGPVEK